MRKLTTTTTLLLFVFSMFCSAKVFAFNTYQSGETAKGREYIESLKRWVDRNLSVWVGVDKYDNRHVLVKGDSTLSIVTVRIYVSQEDDLKEAISKAIEWSNVAKENNAETTKGLGCYGILDEYGVCKDESTAFQEGQMSLKFFSANNGQQTDLIVSLIDRSNQFYKTHIYLDEQQMRVLKDAIEKIPQTYEKAKSQAAKRDLFK